MMVTRTSAPGERRLPAAPDPARGPPVRDRRRAPGITGAAPSPQVRIDPGSPSLGEDRPAASRPGRVPIRRASTRGIWFGRSRPPRRSRTGPARARGAPVRSSGEARRIPHARHEGSYPSPISLFSARNLPRNKLLVEWVLHTSFARLRSGAIWRSRDGPNPALLLGGSNIRRSRLAGRAETPGKRPHCVPRQAGRGPIAASEAVHASRSACRRFRCRRPPPDTRPRRAALPDRPCRCREAAGRSRG